MYFYLSCRAQLKQRPILAHSPPPVPTRPRPPLQYLFTVHDDNCFPTCGAPLGFEKKVTPCPTSSPGQHPPPPSPPSPSRLPFSYSHRPQSQFVSDTRGSAPIRLHENRSSMPRVATTPWPPSITVSHNHKSIPLRAVR